MVAPPAGATSPHFQISFPRGCPCPALCNRHLMALSFRDLLNKPFPPGRTGRPDEKLRLTLLTRLCRDLPQYHLCFACVRLHLWRHLKMPSPNFKLRDCYNKLSHDYDHLKRPLFSKITQISCLVSSIFCIFPLPLPLIRIRYYISHSGSNTSFLTSLGTVIFRSNLVPIIQSKERRMSSSRTGPSTTPTRNEKFNPNPCFPFRDREIFPN